jgi:hypothetical protein
MNLPKIMKIADDLPLRRLRYDTQNERWYYQVPWHGLMTEHRRNDPASLRDLAEGCESMRAWARQ